MLEVDDFIRVLTYPKFGPDNVEIETLLADYLPFTEAFALTWRPQSPQCCDIDNQVFVDKAR